MRDLVANTTTRISVATAYTVPANSRQTIWVDTESPDLAAIDVSAALVASLPIIVQRAMYASPAGQPHRGHDDR